jgi:hypothetical protein
MVRPRVAHSWVHYIHRLHAAKREVLIYDYVDTNEPMLAKMAAKREAGYRSLGYQTVEIADQNLQPTLFLLGAYIVP